MLLIDTPASPANTMDKGKIIHYGDELYRALVDRDPVDPLTNREPGITIDDAYQIQLRMIERRLDKGETVIGKKIGVTSKTVQTMLNVFQPDFGQLLSGMALEKNGEIVSTSAGASVQGSPVNAVAWLANTLGRLGIPLKAGEVILSGSQSPLVPVAAGDNFHCSVGGLGSCSVRFV